MRSRPRSALLRLLEEAGTPPEEARALIAFRLAADADELATLSKFRALRIAWSRVEEACGLEPRAAHVQAESAWRMMTARDPYVNVMRGAAGGVLGRPRRRRQRQHSAAHSGRRPS